MTQRLTLSRIALLMSVPAGLACLVAGGLAAQADQQHQIAEQRHAVAAAVNVVRTRMEGMLDATLAASVGLAHWLEAQDGRLDAALFDQLARKVLVSNTQVRSIDVAPADVVAHSDPTQARHPRIEADARTHAAGGRQPEAPVLAGPVELAGGGRGLVLHLPVHIHGGDRYWGRLDVLSRADVLTETAAAGTGLQLRIALRNAWGQPVGGDDALFADDPVLSDVNVPGGRWQLGAVPAEGWARPLLSRSRHLYVGGTAGLLLTGLLLMAAASLRRSHRQTSALSQEVQVRKSAEEGLKLAGAAFSSSSEAIIIMGGAFEVLSVNPAFSEMSGFSAAEVLGTVPPFLDPQASAEAPSIVSALRSLGKWRGEILNLRHSGERYPSWVTINAVQTGSGASGHYVAVCSDISVIKQTEQELDRLAHYDILTALPNRLLFRRRLVQDIGAATPEAFCALMLLDIDGFKGVNDSYGHQVGDRLLREIAGRLLAAVRGRDTVARLGGDEFAVILTGLSQRDTAVEAASRIIRDMQLPFHIDDIVVHVSVSIGIACCPEDGADEVMLTRNADAAMYAAKEAGRSTYRFYQYEMTRAVRERLLMEQRMRDGLDAGQFEVWFQPRVDLRSGEVIGAEGLVRWRDPEHGLVSPGLFIPLAERSPLIFKLGRTVIEQVIGHAQRWHAQGLAFGKLSMNVATPQIERGNLIGELRELLAGVDVPRHMLELEVTESLFMADADRARRTLAEIRDMGLSIAIDDFGTGYSSLAYLKTLPVNHLKIDRAFVKDLPGQSSDAAIVRAVLTMSQSMGFQVTAEGIETPAQVAFLAAAGCTCGQGFLFHKPMPADEIEALLRRPPAAVSLPPTEAITADCG
jgi:diguanylate cyclase (GGDEF)-like protein/PAS domain S-box-containing protein